MDRPGTSHSSASESGQSASHSGTASQPPPSASAPALGPRHSPVTPLAPLEFLQNQRRGSITDPSLHAGPSIPTHLPNGAPLNNLRPPFRRPSFTSSPSFAPSTLYHDASRPPPGPHRAPSPYRFGDASMPPPESSKRQSRRAPRSSSADAGKKPLLTDTIPELESDAARSLRDSRQESIIRESSRAQGSDDMEIDPQEFQERGGGLRGLQAFREPVGYNARRHSIAAGLPSLSQDRHSPGWPQGTKRKTPSAQDTPSPGNREIDPLLAGPGAANMITDEGDGPAPKRRGSAFDTQNIAQLSLNDRHSSGDTRAGGGNGGSWWSGERRDSAASSSLSASTPSSAFAGESPHGRPPGGIATFAWPANPQDQAAMQSEANVNMAGPAAHPYDPLAIMPPVAFAQDRRMSVPNLPPENLPTPPSTGPTRVLRSRSRPPSRVRGASQSDASNVAGPSSGVGQPDDAAAQENYRFKEGAGTTPYSRSPELRVSHKLAERKRRKEMKELFDELREHLPADRGMKASKWEILSKAIDFINNLKHTCTEMQREIDMLRHEVETMRHGLPPPYAGGPPPPGVLYGHGPPPPVGAPPYPHPGPPHPGPPPSGPPPHQPPQPHHVPPPSQPPHPHQHHMHPPMHHPHPPPDDPASRPASSQNLYPPGVGPASMAPPSTAPPGSSIPPPKSDPSP